MTITDTRTENPTGYIRYHGNGYHGCLGYHGYQGYMEISNHPYNIDVREDITKDKKSNPDERDGTVS